MLKLTRLSLFSPLDSQKLMTNSFFWAQKPFFLVTNWIEMVVILTWYLERVMVKSCKKKFESRAHENCQLRVEGRCCLKRIFTLEKPLLWKFRRFILVVCNHRFTFVTYRAIGTTFLDRLEKKSYIYVVSSVTSKLLTNRKINKSNGVSSSRELFVRFDNSSTTISSRLCACYSAWREAKRTKTRERWVTRGGCEYFIMAHVEKM